MGLEKIPEQWTAKRHQWKQSGNCVDIWDDEMYAAATNRVFHLILSCIENPIYVIVYALS